MSRDFVIVSPEKVSLEYRLAGLGSRIVAAVIDLTIWFGILSGLGVVFALILGSSGGLDLMISLLGTIWICLIFFVFFAYYIFFEIRWNGQTPGKRAMGIRVVKDNGSPVDVASVLKRNFLRLADFAPGMYIIGGAVAFFSPRTQRLGDMAAGTILVRERRAINAQERERLFESQKLAEVAEHPLSPYVGSLSDFSADDYRAVRIFLERRPSLPLEMQYRMGWQMLEPLLPRLQIHLPPNVPPGDMLEAIAAKYAKENGLI